MSENIIAASKSNLFKGCKVISELNSLFKHNFMKFVFLDLIYRNSGRYLPACLINHTGLKVIFFFLNNVSFNECINIDYLF